MRHWTISNKNDILAFFSESCAWCLRHQDRRVGKAGRDWGVEGCRKKEGGRKSENLWWNHYFSRRYPTWARVGGKTRFRWESGGVQCRQPRPCAQSREERIRQRRRRASSCSGTSPVPDLQPRVLWLGPALCTRVQLCWRREDAGLRTDRRGRVMEMRQWARSSTLETGGLGRLTASSHNMAWACRMSQLRQKASALPCRP